MLFIEIFQRHSSASSSTTFVEDYSYVGKMGRVLILNRQITDKEARQISWYCLDRQVSQVPINPQPGL